MKTPRHSNAARRLVGVALLALLLAQWTALTHAIAHVPLGAGAMVAAQADTAWGHQAGAPACALVDHLLFGQLSGGDCAAIPWFLPTASPAAAPRLPIVCGVALRAYEARGPPRA